MRPIRLHLDTSDYAEMYRAAPDSPAACVRDKLKALIQIGHLQIGLSYHVVFELLQKAEPKYREDRLARARLLTELCGHNAFPYPSDLGQGYRFSTEGLWIPRIEAEQMEIGRVVRVVIDATLRHLGLSRQRRRALSRRNSAGEILVSAGFVWPFPFAKELAENGDFEQYLMGKMTRGEINGKLLFYLTDPVTVYKTWFEDYGRDSPIMWRRDALADKLILILTELPDILFGNADLLIRVNEALHGTGADALGTAAREKLMALKEDIKTFREEMTSPIELTKNAPGWKKLVGEESGLLAAQILYAFHREKRQIIRSDAIDLLHAMYLPHTDLWRGDKAFSAILIKNKVNFWERIVPTLLGLPERIEAEIARWGEGISP